ncbi:hypothetical protein EF384_01255 [Aerococcus agrisoli]|uniref:Uncharacterized protein n=1 Tax=Aerococcus agrisoli TaxID=2487350 RepID=A0A3N4GS32_9LACT|nr:hypothetical protein [Aerococcus agrisoli]RPA65065.1 hypothetical protein EF384_01255 [Aerococcus agrisoli]
MTSYAMKYECKLPNDGSHDQGVTLELPSDITLLVEIENDPEDSRYFQRTKVYRLSNGKELIVIEEEWSDSRILRFNYPFNKKGDTLVFNFD